MSQRKTGIDIILLVVTVLLIGIGLVMVYSSSFAVAKEKFGSSNFFVMRHLSRLLLGFCGLYVAMNVDYHKWARVDKALLLASMGALVFLLIGSNVEPINGARRWIRFGSFSFQPSELTKLVLVIYMARSLSEKHDKLSSFTQGLLPHLAILGVTAALIAAEPNFSTAVAILVIVLAMIYVAGMRLHHLLALVACMIPTLYLMVLRAPYRKARLLAFLDPSAHSQNIGYQAHQAIIGLGAGGLFGSGLGQSRQKLFYLPEPYTDFVYSILGEELGFVGSIVVLALFAVLAWRGIRITLHAPDLHGYYLAFGITAMFSVYVLFHVGVATSLLPTTGIPMPFISYGGMSLIFTMISIGVLLNISGQAKENPLEHQEPIQDIRHRTDYTVARQIARRRKKRWSFARFSNGMGRSSRR